MNLKDRKIVLNLNAGWQAIDIRTVAEAFVAMNGGTNDEPPVRALDITYKQNPDGSFCFDELPLFAPVTWVEWIDLPIRPYDLVINTPNKKIRVPTVLVAAKYNKIPTKRIRPNKKTLYELQNRRCGYTGDIISFNQGNIEHKTPKSLGGKDTFENLMIVKKEINSKRGNKPLELLNLKPLFAHREPQPIPVSFTINFNEHPDWKWFNFKN